MEERGDGTATFGESRSHTVVNATPHNCSQVKGRSDVGSVPVGGEGLGSPLPLRKRQFGFSVFESSGVSSLSEDIKQHTESSVWKKQDPDLSKSVTTPQECQENSGFSVSVKRKHAGSHELTRPSKKQRLSAVSWKEEDSNSVKPEDVRRSRRTSFPLGFYSEREQLFLAPFRETLSFPTRRISLSSSPRSETNSPSKSSDCEIVTDKKSPLCSEIPSNAGGPSVSGKIMSSEQSWHSESGSSSDSNKGTVWFLKTKDKRDRDSVCLNSSLQFRNSKMGTLNSSFSSTGHESQGQSVLDDLAESSASTSERRSDMSDEHPSSVKGGATPKVLAPFLRRLPRRKKSSLSKESNQTEGEDSQLDSCTDDGFTYENVATNRSEFKSKRPANHTHSDPLSVKETFEGKDKSLVCGSTVTPLKLYPLRNRLRLSDSGPSSIVSSASGSNENLHVLGSDRKENSVLSSRDYTNLQQPGLSPQQQSQSLPSSPLSPGVAFLDTFRRLRESRRSSQDHNSALLISTPRRNIIQVKDTRGAAGSWKRNSSSRKSPLSSKRTSRGKAGSSRLNIGQQGSKFNIKSPYGSVQDASSLAAGAGGDGLVSGLPLSDATIGTFFTSDTVGLPSISLPGSSVQGLLTATSTSSSALVTPSALSSNGAVGGSGSGSGISGSSQSLGNSGMIGSLMSQIGTNDSESDENEMGRLESLLASRGLPPSLFGALGPRMQHILHRSVSSSISSKAQQLLVGLQASGDESTQLQAVIEMCQLLVMGNEDTLAGFPIKQVTPALINLLNMEHNFDMMNHACRALTYMMEALPRSSAVVVEAVPVFLDKLKVIQCMDVAEQSLTALNMLSKKHAKAILQAHGVAACLMFIDFFSTGAQRAALSITANCCQNLTADEFHYIAESLPQLSARITTQGDKKCVESVCLAFSRLVDCFQNDPNRLREIAGENLLPNIQQLLVMSPPVLSSGTFIMVMRMLSVMCSSCPELAVMLLKNNIAQTLCYLLTNATEPSEPTELVSRSPQELYEITSLIGELMPVLPTDGIFSIDRTIQKPQNSVHDEFTWQWQDDRGTWQNYSSSDSRIIEIAHQSGEDEIALCIHGRAYTLDFHSMQQINDNTGTMRSVQRKLQPSGAHGRMKYSENAEDARAVCLNENKELASNLIVSLFNLLYEVYGSSAGPAVRYKCLRALLRMVHFSSPELLSQILKSQEVSSHLATMLSSVDLKIIVGALQMAELLMTKLPQIFAIYFRREGVMHQIRRLCDAETTAASTSIPLKTPTPTSQTERGPLTGNNMSSSGTPLHSRAFNGSCVEGTESTSSGHESKLPSPQLRISDVLKRKRSKGACRLNSGTSWRSRRQELTSSPTFGDFLMKNTTLTGSRDSWRGVTSRTKMVSDNANTSVSGSSRTTSFLANLNPVRWGRCNSSAVNVDSSQAKEKNTNISNPFFSNCLNNVNSRSLGKTASGPNNREVIRTWIKEQAQRIHEQYFTTEMQGSTHPALTVLNRLIIAISQLEKEPECAVPALKEISDIVSESDISPFEVIHSGLVRTLLIYLTTSDGQLISEVVSGTIGAVLKYGIGSGIQSVNSVQEDKEKAILEGTSSKESDSFIGFPALHTSPSSHAEIAANVSRVGRDVRIRTFLHVFLGCSLNPLSFSEIDTRRIPLFSALVTKLNGCVNHLEQFPVKVHDLPGSGIAGSSRGGSTSAIKFFNTHQLKCNLQRHPECSKLRQWRGGPVKVDPLALVQAIERYLVIRGYGRLRDDDDDNTDDDNSDEDIDDTLAAISVNQASPTHKLQFLIGDHVLPYNMTVYQAIRQFSSVQDSLSSEADNEMEMPISQSAIWLQTHTIYYRPVPEEATKPPPSRKGKGSTKASPKKRGDILMSEMGIFGGISSVLERHLSFCLPASVTVQDPSLEVLALLRVLFTINRHYGSLYLPSLAPAPLPTTDFVNLKLTAKANRQLQDPLVIMTGNLPSWLPQISYACPFLFPFETRQLLFYAVSFDRDRALQRLIDSTPELTTSDSSERVTPRLERRKRTVSREDILKQAETVISDLASSRAMLEIQYENEVGTGLGPTLEFYALVSKELQKSDLDMWRGEVYMIEENSGEGGSGKPVKYVLAKNGLYPLPLSRNAKSSLVNKVKSKFRFLGKFMAKAVMDSRMLDIPLNECMYKWLLGEERALTLDDISVLDPELGSTLTKIQSVVVEKNAIQSMAHNEGWSADELQKRLDNLSLDDCQIESLSLTFTLPGYSNIELRKGGAEISVTANNIEEYFKLVVDWILRESVWRQMESLKEGFESVFPLSQLQVFYSEELEQLFCGSCESYRWDTKQLAECFRPDHGYTHNSRAVKCLIEILSEYIPAQQRAFLQFVTGSPRLPVGGFRSLSPPLTIVRKTFEAGENPDNFLPSVMTCVNYLKLPDYSSKEIMQKKLEIAALEGQHCFHLS